MVVVAVDSRSSRVPITAATVERGGRRGLVERDVEASCVDEHLVELVAVAVQRVGDDANIAAGCSVRAARGSQQEKKRKSRGGHCR